MLNKSYETVWNSTTRTYAAGSEVTKGRGGRGVAGYSALLAVGTSLFGTLVMALPAKAAGESPNPLMNAPVEWDVADPATVGQTPESNVNRSKTLTLATAALADPVPVTQFIAVSQFTTPALTTSASGGENAMAIGVGAMAIDNNALAVGTSSGAARVNTTAVGAGAAALAPNATVVGAGATSNNFAENGVAIGYNAAVQNVNALAIGTSVQTNAANSIAAGSGAFIAEAATKAIAFGSGATATAAGSVALGADSSADRANTVSVGSATLQRQIANVAAGTQGSDATNVSQLKGMAGVLGGGTDVAADGTIAKPVYKVGGRIYNDVGSALAAVVTTTTQASADSVQYDSSSHDTVTLGSSSAPVRLTNVRAANLAAGSSDAVNGAQLFATNQAVAQNTGSITNLDQRVTDNTTNISNLDRRVTDNTTNISNLDQRVTDNTTNISNLDQRTTDNTTNISKLDQRTTTIEGDVSNITNQISNGEIGLVQQDHTSRNLTVAKDTNGARVDFTGTGGARELTGIAAGTTDASAVSLGQLRPMVAALGGGAQINADGSLTGPSYHMQGGTQTTVGNALDSLDTGLNTLQQSMQSGGIGMVTQDPVSRVINVGAITDGKLIDMAGTAGNRVVTGVAAGTVGPASSNAVNGSQLYAQAASTAVALGGGATVNADGSVSAPSYSVGGTVVNNVGGAITNLDGRVTQNSSDIAGLQSTVGNLGGAVANAVQYDSSAHDRITLGGAAANAPKVQLTNLQDGTLSATSTDAVTGAQLWTTNQTVSTLSQQINVVRNNQTSGTPYVAVNSSGNAAQAIGNGSVAIGGGAKASAPNSVAIGEGSVADVTNTVSVGSSGSERRITNVAAGQGPTDAVNMQQFQGGLSDMARSAYSGTASALALTSIPEVDATKNLAIGVGTAGYKGYQAVAVGLSARVTQSLKVKLGAGISSATTAVTAGAAYQW
ncbi:YadA-like family protein [Paraburkholderia sp. BL17N1]|uniref:YadA-like family protein n=1 Tax=Paraburkholderia sp. BL17N1 TaxID=1938798 RepID=UPI000EB02AC3|nr:YadA-like family protein [Paraburkholderia sp. BL17N1]